MQEKQQRRLLSFQKAACKVGPRGCLGTQPVNSSLDWRQTCPEHWGWLTVPGLPYQTMCWCWTPALLCECEFWFVKAEGASVTSTRLHLSWGRGRVGSSERPSWGQRLLQTLLASFPSGAGCVSSPPCREEPYHMLSPTRPSSASLNVGDLGTPRHGIHKP